MIKKILRIAAAVMLAALLLPGNNALASTEVTQTVTNTYDSLAGSGGYDTKLYQAIQLASSNVTVQNFKFSMSKDASTTGTVYVRIYSTSGRTDTGGTLLESQSVDVTTITSGSWNEYTYTLNGGLGYFISTGHMRIGVEFSGGDASHRLWVQQSNTTKVGYTGLDSLHAYRSSTWYTQAVSGQYGDIYWKYTYDVGDTTGGGASGVPIVLTAGDVYPLDGDEGYATSAVVDVGSANVTSWGLEWGTSTGNYTTSQNFTGNEGAAFEFTSNITGLSVGSTYYYRAHATNSVGTAYGAEFPFIFASYPVIDNLAATKPLGQDATFGMSISDTGWTGYVSSIGFVWGTSSGVYDYDVHENGSYNTGWHWLTASRSYFSDNTTYYVKAYAQNTIGLAFSNELSFVTSITSSGVSRVTTGGAQTNGAGVAVAGLSYRFSGTIVSSTSPVTMRGFYYGTAEDNLDITISETSGTGFSDGPYSMVTPFNLPSGTTIYYRAWILNSTAVYEGETNSITASPVSTGSVAAVDATVSGTDVNLEGRIQNAGTWGFTRRGFRWSTSSTFATSQSWQESPAGIDFTYANGSFAHTIYNLTPSTTYYWSAGVYFAGSWTWSDGSPFTTGTQNGAFTLNPPVVSIAASDITAYAFTATLTISSVGGGNVTSWGMRYAYDGQADWQEPYTETGNVGGATTKTFGCSLTQPGKKVWIQGFAVNNLDVTGYSSMVPVQLLADIPGVPPPGSGDDSPGVDTYVTPVNDSLNNTLKLWGLNNYVGRWVAVVVLMLVAYLIFRKSELWSKIMPGLVFGFGIIQGWIDLTTIIIIACCAALFIWSRIRHKTVGGAE